MDNDVHNQQREKAIFKKFKSVTIQGQSEAHISCVNLIFRTRFTGIILKVTLSNLVFRASNVILDNVCSFNVTITNCKFMNCSYGVGVRQKESLLPSCQKSTLAVSDSEFWYCANSIKVLLYNEFFNLTISRCIFQGRKGQFNVTSGVRNTTAAVYVRSPALKELSKTVYLAASIVDSIFRELGHENNGFAFSVRIRHVFSNGSLTLSNTSFLNNENAVFVHGGFDLRLTKVTINCTNGYAFTASGPPKSKPTYAAYRGIKVLLDECLLSSNRIGIRMSTTYCFDLICSTSDQTLVVKNSLFLGHETRGFGDAIRFAITRPTQKPQQLYLSLDFEAKLLLENVTFRELHGCALSVEVDKNVHGLMSFKNCKFLNNSQLMHRLVDRATVHIEIKDDDPPKCRERTQSNSNEFIWKKNITLPVTFEDCIFEGNVGVSGALDLMNGNVTIINCRFKDNEGLTPGGHVFMKTGYGRLNIVNSSFLQTAFKRSSNETQPVVPIYSCFLRSESVGPVTIENSPFTDNVDREFYNPQFEVTKCSSIIIDNSSTLQCRYGRQMKQEKIVTGFELVKDGDDTRAWEGDETCWTNVSYIKFFCDECPDGFYTLQRGSTNGLNINKGTECLKCPYGATCENGNIIAKQNFWGFNISTRPPSLQFISCPLEYCRTPTHSSRDTYNVCHGNRSGVLCGQCSDGYSEVLYSTSCRKIEKCNDHWFWVASFIYVMFFALYIVFKPPIFSLLYQQSFWFTKKAENVRQQSLEDEDNSEKHDAGYLKIVFYFYQVAELVMVRSPENIFHMVPFIPPVIALFNFQVKTINGSIGCPFPGLDAVTKELFMCVKFLATLLSIGFIYAFHRFISKSFFLTAPSFPLYLAVALETLLLGYETLADTSLELMHCVPIGQDWRLFIDGNIQCWQWWQHLLIVFIVVFVVPLVLVLFWGSMMLSKDRVSAKEFLISCAFPLPLLLIWLFRYCKRRPNRNQSFPSGANPRGDADEIKKVLHDPFRPSSDGKHGTLYWDGVLTGRRFILLTIHAFSSDPMMRFVCLDFACFLILLHHLAAKPFRDRKANMLESLSLISLVAICTINLAEATYISEGIEPTGPSKSLLHAFLWIEIVLLGLLPSVACLLVVFAVLSQVIRVLFHCTRLLSDVIHEFVPGVMPFSTSSRSRQQVLNDPVSGS